MPRALPAFLIALVGVTSCGGDPAPALVRAGDSLDTVRPTAMFQGTKAASISAARNEVESFQVVVQALDQPIRDVRVQVGHPLRGSGGTIPPQNVTIYREAYIDLKAPSDLEGATGRWPDALIPTVDRFFHEPRNAFPVTVPAHENRAAWVDVHVPAHQAPGTYTGTIRVTGASGMRRAVDVQLEVRGFTLPSTPSLKTAFFAGRGTCEAHFGKRSCERRQDRSWAIKARYVAAGLENRITTATPAYEPPIRSQRGRFRRFVQPMIDGTRPLQLEGARLTTISVLPDQYVGAWRRTAVAGGFTRRSFLYACDEPGAEPSLWQACVRNEQRAARVWPGLPPLVTASIREARDAGALDGIDILTPIINQLDDKPGSSDNTGDQSPTYDPFRARGGQLWTYVACLSHGCSGDLGGHDPYWEGWPAYVIDQPASEHRALGMLAFRYGATGILYFDTGYDLATAWTNQRAFGGNGEGTLFYPGTPDRVGGIHDIPIESIRLKRIRDGVEDYEYLHQLAAAGHGAEAEAVVTELFPHAYDAAVPPERFESARDELANLLGRGG